MRLNGLAVFAICMLLQGCANLVARADRWALNQGYQKLELPGETFRHIAYFKPASIAANPKVLHVYIEHDGTPWTTPTTPSADPTPLNPLMLHMLALDVAPALYLGRPCYWGMFGAPPCEPIWWTHRRFSPEVVRNMAVALRSFLGARPDIETIHLFGYSGGGVVAALLAAHFSNTKRLVTIAAPLDLDAWVHLHGFSPMEGSLNPLRQPPLPATVEQVHFAGSLDEVVPGYLIRRFVDGQVNARFVEVRGFVHDCCWVNDWAALLVIAMGARTSE